MAGVVPRDWRRAVFVPIHKQGSRKLRLLLLPGTDEAKLEAKEAEKDTRIHQTETETEQANGEGS